ncbi:MAG: twin transmembrane helix small protein [Caedimonadaceae bacterium]|nr:MAG: twin transmembrane helix small protein [Caedimonadaceae bacterium]
MTSALNILMILAMIATAVTLGIGIFSLLQKKSLNPETSNRMMRYRVFFQALTLVILSILFYVSKKSGG